MIYGGGTGTGWSKRPPIILISAQMGKASPIVPSINPAIPNPFESSLAIASPPKMTPTTATIIAGIRIIIMGDRIAFNPIKPTLIIPRTNEVIPNAFPISITYFKFHY